jgi:hypothetical protein
MSTSFRVHFGCCDGDWQLDAMLANIGMKVSEGFRSVGPVPYEVHGSSDFVYYMADDALTYGDLQLAYKLWDMSEYPEEWVEVFRPEVRDA